MPDTIASQAVGVVTDALNQLTTYSLDDQGRLLQLQTPDGASRSWQRDGAGDVTAAIDPLGRTTDSGYLYGSGKGDLAQVINPDGSVDAYQYDATFHELTRGVDTLGHVTTQTIDPSTGDVTAITNALNQVTTLTWSNGLLQTETDPLGHTTTFLYDSARRLTGEIDALGNRTTYGYDAAGNQTTVQDANGHITTSTYDGMGRVLTETNAAGGITTFVYNALGEVTSETDPLGRVTQYTYDQHGWLTAVTEAAGTADQATTTTVYDALGRPVNTIDPDGHLSTMTYDAVGRLKTETSPVGGVDTFTYDAAGQLLAETDANGHTTSHTYNSRGWETGTTDALGHVTSTTFDTEGNVLSTTDQNGTVTSFAYDALNRQTVEIDAYGLSGLQRSTTTTFDAAGNVLSVTDPLNHVTRFGYDADNRRTVEIDAYGTADQTTTTTNYDPVGNVLSQVDARGYATTYGYDALNRAVQTTNALGGIATVAYDAVGNVTGRTDERGNRTTLTYDNLNREVSVTDPAHDTTTTVYDKASNVVKTLDALGNATTMSYDAANRLVSTQLPSGGISTNVYDLVGNVVQTIDPLSHATSFVYDALNRRTALSDARGGVTSLSYDNVGNETGLTDSVGNHTSFAYDALQRMTLKTDPLGHASSYAYDADDNLTSTTDRDGRVTNDTYDNLNRLKTQTWIVSGSTMDVKSYNYDANGNVLVASDNNGTYTMAYDPLNRLTSEQAPFGVALTFGYDAVGNRTSVQDSFGGTTTSVYDQANRLTSRQFQGTGVQGQLRIDLSYTARDQLAGLTRYADVTGLVKVGSSAYTYDAAGRVTNIEHANAVGLNLDGFTYTYDQANRLTSENDNGTSTSYNYDNTNQLTQDGSTSYNYDLNGNRTNTGYQTGADNRLLSDGTWSYSYDNEGNLIKKTKGASAETWTYGYDSDNHLVWAEDRATDGGTLLQRLDFKYDVFGNRIEKDVTSGGTTTVTRFAYDGQEVWADLSGSNALQTRYLRGDVVDQVFARMSATGVAGWYLTDHLGSVRDVTDGTGAVLDHIDYTAFGAVKGESNPTLGDRYKYAGYQYDSEMGAYNEGVREYDPQTGRFWEEDPLGLSPDTDPFRYTQNSPTNGTDPSGLEWRPLTRDYFLLPAIGELAWSPVQLSTEWYKGTQLDEKVKNLPVVAEAEKRHRQWENQQIENQINYLKNHPPDYQTVMGNAQRMAQIRAELANPLPGVYQGPSMRALGPGDIDRGDYSCDETFNAAVDYQATQIRHEKMLAAGYSRTYIFLEDFMIPNGGFDNWSLSMSGIAALQAGKSNSLDAQVRAMGPEKINGAPVEPATRSIELAPNRRPLTAYADVFRDLPTTQRPGAVAELQTPVGTFFGRSNFQGPRHPVLQQLLDAMPVAERSRFHGGCADVDVIDQALRVAQARTGQPITTVEQARQALLGSTLQTARVRPVTSPQAAQHGTSIPPCDTCQPLIDTLGITYR